MISMEVPGEDGRKMEREGGPGFVKLRGRQRTRSAAGGEPMSCSKKRGGTCGEREADGKAVVGKRARPPGLQKKIYDAASHFLLTAVK